MTDESFEDLFNCGAVVYETRFMSDSVSPDWWISSGAYVTFDSGRANTIQGVLPEGSEWQIRYARSNPEPTDGGFHPQNIFRMVTRSRWLTFWQQCYFHINRLNLSASVSRNQSNGLFLFNRYQDQHNVYYTGLRVDGDVVIKKKYRGVYYTLAQAEIFEGEYDRDTRPNLLPLETWIGVASEVKTLNDRSVEIRLHLDLANCGEWKQVLTAIDNGISYGGEAILDGGYAGIRTDFMDVSFDHYRIRGDCAQD